MPFVYTFQNYIGAKGVSDLSYGEISCSFWGDWLWINNQTPYLAVITIQDGVVDIQVDGIGSASATSDYSGVFNTLWIGQEGGSNWPGVSGTIDYVIIESLSTHAVTGQVTDGINPIPYVTLTSDSGHNCFLPIPQNVD